MVEESAQGAAGAPRPRLEEGVLQQVTDAIRGIEFGSVLIKVHQGEVVGIETSTKIRLRNPKK